MANILYPNPTFSYWDEPTRRSISNSALNNALIMAGLSMLGAPRTPYPQTFTENLAQGLGTGFSTYNQIMAGAQQQARNDYWNALEQANKNRQLEMQESLNKAHADYYATQAEKTKNELERLAKFQKDISPINITKENLADILSGRITSLNDRLAGSQELANALSELQTGNTVSDITISPSLQEMVDAYARYYPDKGIDYQIGLQKMNAPKTLEELLAIKMRDKSPSEITGTIIETKKATQPHWITMIHPKTKRAVKVIAGSDEYSKLINEGWNVSTPLDAAGLAAMFAAGRQADRQAFEREKAASEAITNFENTYIKRVNPKTGEIKYIDNRNRSIRLTEQEYWDRLNEIKQRFGVGSGKKNSDYISSGKGSNEVKRGMTIQEHIANGARIVEKNGKRYLTYDGKTPIGEIK